MPMWKMEEHFPKKAVGVFDCWDITEIIYNLGYEKLRTLELDERQEDSFPEKNVMPVKMKHD